VVANEPLPLAKHFQGRLLRRKVIEYADEVRPVLGLGMVSGQDQCGGILSIYQSNTQAIARPKLRGSNHDPGRLLRPRIGSRDPVDELFERGRAACKAAPVLGPT